jgi:hypothetical protein
MSSHSFSRDEITRFAQRYQLLKKTVVSLHQRLMQEELVANRALHELGVARDEQNIPRFMDRFRRETLQNGREELMN